MWHLLSGQGPFRRVESYRRGLAALTAESIPLTRTLAPLTRTFTPLTRTLVPFKPTRTPSKLARTKDEVGDRAAIDVLLAADLTPAARMIPTSDP